MIGKLIRAHGVALACSLGLATSCAVNAQQKKALPKQAQVKQASLESSAAKARAELRGRLRNMASICEKQQMPREASLTREWSIVRRQGRQFLITPISGKDPLTLPPSASQQQKFWHQAIREMRRKHAQKLFQIAKDASRQQPAAAYRLLHEVVREDPEHAEALKILGRDRPARQRIGTRKSTRPHNKLGWPARSYWTVSSPHFSITTNTSSTDGVKLARQLEQLHQVWSQLFFDLWANKDALSSRFAGRNQPLGPVRKHQVVYFRKRQEYVDFFKTIEPRVGITAGYYSDNTSTSYFFAGPGSKPSSRYHEVTHQLFQESRGVIHGIAEKANFWAVEGVAMYMESLVVYPGYCTVGGFDSARLQYARYRRVNDGFYIPVVQLVEMGRSQFQKDERIRRIYTQSAGLAHLMMDYDNGKYRGKFLKYLQAIYKRRDRAATLPLLFNGKLGEIDGHYAKSLTVIDQDLTDLRPPQTLRQLCLCRMEITDKGLQSLRQHDQLRWVDLSFTRIGDQGFAALENAKLMDQLRLERTAVTNASLAQIGRYKQLRELDLSQTKVTSSGLAQLTGLTKLEVLWLSGTAVNDDALAHLEKMKALKQLEVDGTQISAQGLARLKAKLPNLK